MEPRTLRALPALLAITLVSFAGLAAADPLVDATATVQAKAHAHADLSGAQRLAEQAVADARGRADATVHAALDAKAQVEAEARADAQAAGEASGGILGGIQANLAAFGGWIMGLFGSAKATADAAQDVSIQDGALDADLEAASHVDARAAAPPRPDAGFLASASASLAAILHLG